jgi:hypothetical protein
MEKNWRNTTPEDIVKNFEEKYDNLGSRSSSLSLYKRKLMDSKDPPPKEYLDKLVLDESLYRLINRVYMENKQIEGFDMPVVDANRIIILALKNIDTNEPYKIWSSIIALSGFRPVEILTANFSPYDGEDILHDNYYIKVSNLAKKRGPNTTILYRPLLVKSHIWLNAVDKIRAILNISGTKYELTRRYGKTFLRWTTKAFGPDITHVLLRRLYAYFAYLTYKKDYIGQVNHVSFIKEVLGHEFLSTSVIYSLINFSKSQIYNVFDQ